MKRYLIAGNWKMVGSKASVETLLSALKKGVASLPSSPCEWAVFPPAIFLPLTQNLLQGSSIVWGAQNCADQKEGAFTGEIAASMLLEYGCQYVILGHSERRHLYGEKNALIAARFKNALSAGLKPILCVGETLAERESQQSWSVVEEQLAAVAAMLDNPADFERIVVAYEPVWAIGTGKVAEPEMVQIMHAEIRGFLRTLHPETASKVRILYGGSVKPENAHSLLALPDVDGALVGGASLKAEQFLEIGKQCNP